VVVVEEEEDGAGDAVGEGTLEAIEGVECADWLL
jgi:hypothetical protein